MEPLFFESLILRGVESVELGGAVGPVALGFFEGLQEVETQDLLAKVSFINLHSQHGFVKMLGCGHAAPRPS